MSEQKRAAVYVRVSSALQEDGASLETQEEGCRKYAAEHGYQVVAFFREVHTGVDLHERPELTAAREAIRAGEIDVLIAYAVDRLSRSQAHVYIIADEADRYGVTLEFVTEDFEQTATGRFIRSAKAFAAEVEHEKIKERTLRGRLAKVRKGRPLGAGRPPYGYRWRDEDKSGYAVDADEALIVARVFHEVLAGASLRQVAAGLTADGIPTPSGALIRWRQTTIADLLHHPTYAGRAYGWRWQWRKVKVDGKTVKQCIIRDPSEWVELAAGVAPAIIDERTWQAAQQILTHNKESQGRHASHPERFLLRGGFAVCGYCGAPMHAAWRDNGTAIYRCGAHHSKAHPCPQSGSILATPLDEAAWVRVVQALEDDSVIDGELARLQTEDPTQTDLPIVERGLANVSRKQANLLRRMADIDDDGLAEAVKLELVALSTQRQMLQKERERLLERQASWRIGQDRLETLRQWRRTVATRIRSLDYEGKRLALQAVGLQAQVYRYNHEPRFVITLSLPLSPDSGDLSVSSFGRRRRA